MTQPQSLFDLMTADWPERMREDLRSILEATPTFRGVPLPNLHGHYLHACNPFCNGRRPQVPILDLPITIERVGGGAAVEGYGAFVWPDEAVRQPLTEWVFGEWAPVEDYTEADCLARAINALEYQEAPWYSMPQWERHILGTVFLNGPQQLDFHFDVARAVERLDYLWN